MSNIYKSLALKTTKYYVKKSIISESKQDVYSYGFEILISNLVYTLIFIITAIITDTLLESAFFWFGFYILRTICGGYHAKSYLMCHILFFFNHVLFIFFLKFLSGEVLLLPQILITVSSFIVLIIGPVAHPNKPFIKGEKKRFRKISFCYAILLIVIFSIFVLFFNISTCDLVSSYAFGTFSATISLISAKILYKKGEGK